MTTLQTMRRGVVLATVLGLFATGAGAQGMALEPVGEIPGPAELVRIQGDRAYVSGGHTFTIWDVSDPANPVARGSHTFPQEIWGFRLTEERAYVGANFFGLGILDISDPDAPVLLGQHKTLGQTKIGDIASGKVGIIDHMEGFVLIDVADETAPAGIGSFFLDGYARDVVTAGTIAYATDSPSGLYVFDLSRPGMPEPVGVIHAPAAPRDIEVSVGTDSRPTLIVGAGGGDLQIYDVSDPAAPGKLSSFETPGRATRVSLDGELRLRGRHRGRRAGGGPVGSGQPGVGRQLRDAPSGPRRFRRRLAGSGGRRRQRARGARPLGDGPAAPVAGGEDYRLLRRDSHPAGQSVSIANEWIERAMGAPLREHCPGRWALRV